MSLQGLFAMMDAAGHVILRGWCGSSYTPGSPARNGTFFGKESHPWNQQRVGHEFGGPSNIEPGKVLMWFEVEDTGCGKLFFCRINLPLSRTLSLCVVDSLILCHLGVAPVFKEQCPGPFPHHLLNMGLSTADCFKKVDCRWPHHPCALTVQSFQNV